MKNFALTCILCALAGCSGVDKTPVPQTHNEYFAECTAKGGDFGTCDAYAINQCFKSGTCW